MKTSLRKAKFVAPVVGLKALGDPADGIFEAYVSVFGNVDYQGDRIKAGAFSASLERWKASGDPIPVIFSHQWDNLDAHIGEVLSAEEVLPGDPRLAGTGLEENGGLLTKFRVELDEDFASRVAKKLTKRTIREFSFAYDVLDEQKGTDGVNELTELDVLEVGPTLKGANPATVRLAKALADHEAKATAPVTFDGAIENELDAVYRAAHEWASEGNIGNGGFYALHQEATFLSEGRVVVTVEGWDDPYDAGVLYEIPFEKNADGEVTLGEPHELEATVSLAPKKSRSRKGSAARRSLDGTVSDVTKTDGKAKDKVEDPATGKAEDLESRTGSEDEGDDDVAALLDLAELELAPAL